MFFNNSFSQIYDLEKGIEDHKNRLKIAAEVRKNIEEAYKVFNATKTSVQELCSEEVKQVLSSRSTTLPLPALPLSDHFPRSLHLGEGGLSDQPRTRVETP